MVSPCILHLQHFYTFYLDNKLHIGMYVGHDEVSDTYTFNLYHDVEGRTYSEYTCSRDELPELIQDLGGLNRTYLIDGGIQP